jgi:2',3'-cyclic-nucleotide 2'-phosphodiesterase
MKILFVGEIVASPGREAVEEVLPGLIKEYKPDVVLANAENLSGGRGVIEENVKEMQNAGIDFFTSGDHIFWQKGTEDFIDNLPIVRPANYPNGTPGKGHALVDLGKKGQLLVINLMGRTSYGGPSSYLDDPFQKADEILAQYEGKKLAGIFVDFHADSTSEKMALGFYLDGRISAMVGTHIHTPTADGMKLPKGTLYITDSGMTGNVDSVLGVKKDIIIKLFTTARNQRFEWETVGKKAFRGVLFDTDNETVVRLDKEI